jgi:poly(A) polymerase
MTNLTKERLRIFVPEEAVHLLEKLSEFLQQRNTDCYLVGGFVRDGLMGRTNNDIDLAVAGDALKISSEVAKNFDGRMIPLDELNQVARVVFPQAESRWHLDFASLRGNIEEDLRYRDFTINSIAVRLEEAEGKWSQVELIDPLKGYHDLKQRIIRAVSDDSFRQDPARLLRAIRLSAALDFSIEPGTENLIQHDSELIKNVAGERLRDEFCYILDTNRAYSSLCRLDKLGLLAHLMPELTSARGVTQPKEHYWDVFNHSLETVSCVELLLRERATNGIDHILTLAPWSDELANHFSQEISGGRTRRDLLKLAALLHDIAKPATKTIEESGKMRFLGHAKEGAGMVIPIMERFKFSNREIKMVQLMIEHHLRPGYLLSEDMPSRRAIYKYFRDTAEVGIDTLFLGLADHLAARGPTLDFNEWRKHAETTNYILSKWFEEQSTVMPPKLIDGHILMQKFRLAPGAQIGELLEMVREAQASGEINTSEEALDFVAKRLGRNK